MKSSRLQRKIREGFRGQHLVVLPRSIVSEGARHPLLSGLQVTDVGLFPRAQRHEVVRPQGAESTLLILCTAGRGWAQWEKGARREIRAGELLWFPANRAHAYGAAETSPWTLIWVHVVGAELEGWREWLGVSAQGGALPLSREGSREMTAQLEEAYRQLESGYALTQLVFAAVAVRAALTGAGRLRAGSNPEATTAVRAASTVEWMREHLDRAVRLPELAALAGMSVPHYAALFRQTTGYAPVNYHLRLRIQRACQLLDSTLLPVSEVAEATGFSDPYYFSRMFRGIMSRSPRAYRQLQKG